MLKIKDNVDLKELEKFGFSTYKDEIKIDDEKILYFTYCYKDFYLYVTDARNIYGEECDYIKGTVLANENFDTLFDLIQAGLVEKVEG